MGESIHTSNTLIKSVWSPGTTAIFYQLAAPDNWTIVSGFGDTLVGLRDSTTGYDSEKTAGSTAGSWSISDHKHTTAAHTLTVAEMPTHDHVYFIGKKQSGFGGHPFYNYKYYNMDSWNQDYPTTSTGGGEAHEHGDSGEDGGISSWRPAAVIAGIFKKDIP